MRSLRLSRRVFLRGTGIAIGLPTLEAMLNDRGLLHATAYAQAAPPPVRLVTFFLPNGFPPVLADKSTFVPPERGAGYTLTPCLKPIAAHVPDVTLVSGILGQGGPDSHAAGITAFATGLPCTTTGAKGPSIEQLAAQRKGQGTKFPSLVVGVQKTAPYSSNGHSSDVFLNVSWQGAEQLAPAERDPAALFMRLFGAGTPQPDAQVQLGKRNRQSIIDYVAGDIGRLTLRLGASDKLRLDAHLTGVRELERRIALDGAVTCTAPAAPGSTVGHYAKANLMADLLAAALQCNLTRYASFIYADGAGAGGPDDAIGLRGQQHEDAHAAKYDSMTAFTTVQMQCLARFLDKLKAAPEAGQTVLFNSLVYCGTELGNGTAHTKENLPFVLAGRAGGRVKTAGTHVGYSNAPKLGRLQLSVLKLVGIDEAGFAGETQGLPELVG
jgi:Protein of unknown function (DUF1552)